MVKVTMTSTQITDKGEELILKGEEILIQEGNGVNITPNGDLIIVAPMMGGQPGSGRIIRTIASGFWESSIVEESNINVVGNMGVGGDGRAGGAMRQ